MLMGCFHFVWGALELIRKSGHRFSEKDHAQTITVVRPVAGRCSAASMDKRARKIKYGVKTSDLPRSEIARKHKS
jgi:hypothetical protein